KRGLGADQALVEMNESVRRRVIEVGYVDPGDLPKLYVGAKAFLFPSRYEGFGLPLLEAFACGVPVIASDIASIPEVAGEAAILLNVDDVAVWSEAMKRIADDSELREKLIKAGLERVDDYSWVRLAATTWEVLALGLD
ncbi:glycosyltransferase, partial [Patescibacteria group bacterium]|nr:glycosyltransferase [Patescibacteria group bacterium]